eukprot:2336943-Pleurochrysis_carterae.AAC.1
MASIARQPSVDDDLSAGSSLTVEPAGSRARSVCHPSRPALPRAARCRVDGQQQALRRLRP